MHQTIPPSMPPRPSAAADKPNQTSDTRRMYEAITDATKIWQQWHKEHGSEMDFPAYYLKEIQATGVSLFIERNRR